MSYWKDFCYVDAHYEHPTTKRRMPWERVRVGQVGKIIQKANNANVLASVQRFKDAVPLRELAKEAERLRAEQKKAGAAANDVEEAARQARIKEADEMPDGQLHYHGLYFDFDCDSDKLKISEEEAVIRSLNDVRRLFEWFKTSFEAIRPPHLQVWYSGRKGFHLTVRPEIFGIRPHKHLSYIVKHVAAELKTALDLTTLDLAVYSIPRQWRIANTSHPKSGRYKIELYHEEVKSWTAAQIMDAARSPRGQAADPLPNSHLYSDLEYQDIPADPVMASWWQERYATYEAAQDLKNLRPRRAIVRPDVGGEYPVCVQDILNNGPKPGSNHPRNRVTLPIVGFFKDAGLDQQECTAAVRDWTEKHYPGPPSELRQRHANAKSIIDNAYQPASQLRFACRFIRSLSGPGENGRVACVGEEKCPWIGDPIDQEPNAVPMVHLSEATKGCYVGTKIRTEVHVAASAKIPFAVPVKGRVLCHPDPENEMCMKCPNGPGEGAGKMEFTIGVEDRLALEMVNVPDTMKKSALKRKAGIPEKCFRHRFEPDETENIEELQVIPMVDHASTYQVSDENDDSIATKSARHVVRLAYYLGHGIESNKKYRIEASVFGHPRDQRVCFLFDKAEPAQDDIAQFRMTPELHEKLKIFQVKPGQTIEAKLKEIHTDFTANVHQIGGRMSLSIAADLCYHSVIGFKFLGKEIHKGWFELLVVGDSGTGKSTLIEAMIRHYGLGELVAGEDSKRTGLVYASIQMQGQWVLQWGKIPQNDRRLLVIDEFSGIPGEEVSKMTQLRSEGKARGGGVNAAFETWARTRLIFLTNPRNNRGRLAGFNFGIQAIEDLFDDAADLRRVDLALVAERDEVETSLINRRWDATEVPHQYTANLCQSLVLWAWSREPYHVKWMEGAEDEVLRWADRLGDTYDCDVPLAERADLRLKIARISCAVAARVFSTDEEAKKVLVTKDHVEYAALFMDRAYRNRAMSYFAYAKRFKQDNHFTQQRKNDLKKFLDGFTNTGDVVATLLDIDLITKRTFADMLDLPEAEMKRLWSHLTSERLLRNTPKGWRKTVAFTKFLKDLGAAKSGYEVELAEDFESAGNFEKHQQPPEHEPPPPPHWSSRDDEDDVPPGENPPF